MDTSLPAFRVPTALLLAVSFAGCGSTSSIFKAYDGSERPAAETSTIDMRDAVTAVIGDRRVDSSDYAKIQLLPGSYSITWECVFGASVMVAQGGFIRDSATVDVLLQGGHDYSFRCERSHGYGYQTFLWISDDTANMLAAGHRKP